MLEKKYYFVFDMCVFGRFRVCLLLLLFAFWVTVCHPEPVKLKIKYFGIGGHCQICICPTFTKKKNGPKKNFFFRDVCVCA